MVDDFSSPRIWTAAVLLRDLTIENYRSFDKYTLNDLARVNLLVGDNNCGKTSVLEAAYLLASTGRFSTLLEILEAREDLGVYVDQNDTTSMTFHGGSSLFHQKTLSLDIEDFPEISITSRTFTTHEIKIAVILHSGTGYPPAEIVVEIDGEQHVSGSMDADGRIFGPWMSATQGRSKGSAKSNDSLLVPAGGLTTSHLAGLWRTIIRKSLNKHVVTALQVIDGSVSDILFSPDTQHRRDVLVDCDRGRLSLAQFGGGMMYLLAMGCSLASVTGGTLMLDEIDTGLHYSRLPDMWRMVIKTAAELDVQVFATTHSLDCIRGLAEAVEADSSLTDDVAIHRIDRRQNESVRFAGDELSVVVGHEIEVR